MVIELYFVRKQLLFNLKAYLISVLLPILLTLVFTIPLAVVSDKLYDGWKGLIISSVMSIVCCAIIVWVFFLNKVERHSVLGFAKKRLYK